MTTKAAWPYRTAQAIRPDAYVASRRLDPRGAARSARVLVIGAFGPRMVCTRCGIVGADARPDWREMQTSGNWR